MIEIKDLRFSYGSVPVLDNISFTLEQGKIYGLLGENGVGKTTLLTLLAGLKKPHSGSIVAASEEGEYIPFKREPSYLGRISYLPDEVYAPSQKAMAWVKSMAGFWPRFDQELFKRLMSEFELDPETKMNAMSAGQLKKTHICFTLATRASFIFMDEPTNALDIPSKAAFRKALLMATDESSTVVISTHQVRDLENVIDPIIILDKQDVLLNASLETVADKLFFDYGTVLNPSSLYSEQLPGGFIQVYPNTLKQESKVNIEALFNAVHKNKETIKALFANE